MGFVETIEVLLTMRKKSRSELARLLGDSPQNLYLKFKRGTLKDEDLRQICTALDCDFEYLFRDKKTGDVIFQTKL